LAVGVELALDPFADGLGLEPALLAALARGDRVLVRDVPGALQLRARDRTIAEHDATIGGAMLVDLRSPRRSFLGDDRSRAPHEGERDCESSSRPVHAGWR
jgi:hypothetical protein